MSILNIDKILTAEASASALMRVRSEALQAVRDRLERMARASSLEEFLQELQELLNQEERVVWAACEVAHAVAEQAKAKLRSGQAREELAQALDDLARKMNRAGYLVAAEAFWMASAAIRGRAPAQIRYLRVREPGWIARFVWRDVQSALRGQPEEAVLQSTCQAMRGLAWKDKDKWIYPRWGVDPFILKRFLEAGEAWASRKRAQASQASQAPASPAPKAGDKGQGKTQASPALEAGDGQAQPPDSPAGAQGQEALGPMSLGARARVRVSK